MHLDPKTWWYLTRATGLVSWALLAVAVLWGLFITNKTLHRSTAPGWVLDLHRHLGGLAVVFVAVHVGALPLDGFTHWSWSDLFVPMATPWHPLAIAWGMVGMYLLIAVEITSLLGRRFPRKWWRRVHMLSFPLYVTASIHLFSAGTDSRDAVTQWMVVTVSTLIVFLTVVRVLAAAKPRGTGANPRIATARAQSAAAAIAASSTASADTTPVARPRPPIRPDRAGPVAPVALTTGDAPRPTAGDPDPPNASVRGDLLPSLVVPKSAPRRPAPAAGLDSDSGSDSDSDSDSDSAAMVPALTGSTDRSQRVGPPSLDERIAQIREQTDTAVGRARANAPRAHVPPRARRRAGTDGVAAC